MHIVGPILDLAEHAERGQAVMQAVRQKGVALWKKKREKYVCMYERMR